jgi:hypothetical protein
MADPSQDAGQQRNQAIFLARLWLNERLKERVLQDPASVLTEEGMPPPPGTEVTAFENTPDHYYIVLPQRPDEDVVSEEDLAQVAGGATQVQGITAFTAIGCPTTWASQGA